MSIFVSVFRERAHFILKRRVEIWILVGITMKMMKTKRDTKLSTGCMSGPSHNPRGTISKRGEEG
jgi:hypothetical protein